LENTIYFRVTFSKIKSEISIMWIPVLDFIGEGYDLSTVIEHDNVQQG
jgi:hypothetical protein